MPPIGIAQCRQQGDALAQTVLGAMYEVGGTGVAQDYVLAVDWFRKAAEQGYALAQINLGNMYERGWGVAQSDCPSFSAWVQQGSRAAERGRR